MKILTDKKYNALLSEIKDLKLDNELYEKTIKEKNKDDSKVGKGRTQVP